MDTPKLYGYCGLKVTGILDFMIISALVPVNWLLISSISITLFVLFKI